MPTPKTDRIVTLPTGARINMLRLAKLQRTLLLLILSIIICYLSIMAVGQASRILGASLPMLVKQVAVIALVIVYIVLIVAAIVTAIRLAIGLGTNKVLVIGLGVLMLVPVLGLILVLILNMRATRLLKQQGITVGMLGVTPDEMHKLRMGACPSCGYDVRSIHQRNCPECGAALPSQTPPTR